MKENLIIIGSYPNTDVSVDVLKKCINSLNKRFDIALSTHYAINPNLQKLCKYYIYDSENEVIEENNNPIVWFKNDLFYLQIKHAKNHAFSAYSTILNAVNLLNKKYEDFFYINGDTLLSDLDIEKLIDLKICTKNVNKNALFFKEFEGMVEAKVFYSNINFFINNFANVKTKYEFIKYTQNFLYPYVPNVLESYFAERINNHFSNEILVKNQNLENYFNNSQIDVLISFNGNSELKRDFQIHLVKENKSNKIFFVYINNNKDFQIKKINIKINDRTFTLDNGYYSFFQEVLYNDEKILLEVDDSSKIYYVNDIINNNESYIQFN